ncbi:hypothetical protein NEMIN01_0348 [Nematocida minor]|uniref:uncharacterized protein n=1 Tax=Nematocida minor TaxID=1912983 RepID=UPI0022212538|nr:uncharacterized protein NEMIN01_0348 [Nematocida minor]KAI5189182.1 hypothetical protein NEMIN01_0348 [Nematocida minor]
MFLQRAMKQAILIVAAILAYSQGANALLYKDIVNIENYWSKRLTLIETEAQIRSDFLSKAGTFSSENIPDTIFKKDIKDGKENLSKIETDLLIFKESVENIKEAIKIIMGLNANTKWRLEVFRIGEFMHQTNRAHDSLEVLLLPALEKGDAVADKIKEFDSHMLAAIEKYSSKIKDGNTDVSKLAVFELAKSNKPLCAAIIYSIFRIEPFKSGAAIVYTMTYLEKNLKNYLFFTDFSRYIQGMMGDVNKGGDALLEIADRNLHLLFERHGVAADVMNIYLSLVKEGISKTEINQCKDITPGQIMKILIVEYIINGCSMDFRRNDLLFNLGEVIASVGRAASDSANVQEDMKKAREKQDEILDALHLLWNNREFKEKKQESDLEFFCENNDIKASDFETVQSGFMSAIWMYKLKIESPDSKELANDQKLLKKVCFDMSYTHPILYIYKRCEDMSHMVKKGLKSNEKHFISRDILRTVTLRPYRIGKTDRNSVRAENIRDCIRIWFAKRIEVIYRKEDGEEYYNVAREFETHLNRSQYVIRAIKG